MHKTVSGLVLGPFGVLGAQRGSAERRRQPVPRAPVEARKTQWVGGWVGKNMKEGSGWPGLGGWVGGWVAGPLWVLGFWDWIIYLEIYW